MHFFWRPRAASQVGFSQKNHGFLNPQQNIIQNVYPKQTSYYDDYKPVPFYPTDPKPNYDIHICNIPLIKVGNKQYMMTEDKKEQPLSYESAIAEILKKQKQNNDTVTEQEADDNDKESEWKQL